MQLFARREPTTDPLIREFAPNSSKQDVVLYQDRNAKTPVSRYSWDSTQPHPSHKTIMHNCASYELLWLDPVVCQPS